MPPIRTSILAAAVILSGAAHAQPASKPTDPQIAHIAYTAGQIDIKAAEENAWRVRIAVLNDNWICNCG